MGDCVYCSFCCNEEEYCLDQRNTWPKATFLKVQEIGTQTLNFISQTTMKTFLLFVITFTLVVLCCFFMRLLLYSKSIPQIPFKVGHGFQQQSVYKFFLSGSWFAWGVAFVILIIQNIILLFFVTASDATTDSHDWDYSYSCPKSSLTCDTSAKVTAGGWTFCVINIFLFLSKDFVDGFFLLYESVSCDTRNSILEPRHLHKINFSKRGIFASAIVLYITFFTLFTSIIYNYATGSSNTDILQNAVLLLFLNDIDEKFFATLKRMCPAWVEGLEREIDQVRLSFYNVGNIEHVSDDDSVTITNQQHSSFHNKLDEEQGLKSMHEKFCLLQLEFQNFQEEYFKQFNMQDSKPSSSFHKKEWKVSRSQININQNQVDTNKIQTNTNKKQINTKKKQMDVCTSHNFLKIDPNQDTTISNQHQMNTIKKQTDYHTNHNFVKIDSNQNVSRSNQQVHENMKDDEYLTVMHRAMFLNLQKNNLHE